MESRKITYFFTHKKNKENNLRYSPYLLYLRKMNKKLSLFLAFIIITGISMQAQVINYSKYSINAKEFQDLKKRILIIEKEQANVVLSKDIRIHNTDTLYTVSVNPTEELKKLGKEYEWKFNDSIVFLSQKEIEEISDKTNYAILRLVKHNIYTTYGVGSYSGYPKWYYLPLEKKEDFYRSGMSAHNRFSNYMGMSVPTLGSSANITIELSMKMLCHYFNKLSEYDKPVPHHIVFKKVEGQIPPDSIFSMST